MRESAGPPRDESESMPSEATRVAEQETVPVGDEVIGRAFLWSLAVLVTAGVVAAAAFLFTRGTSEQTAQAPIKWPVNLDSQQVEAKIPSIPFTNVTEQAGVRSKHVNGATGDRIMPEIMGSGCVFFDFDRDDDQDLLLLNFNHWPGKQPNDAAVPTMQLFENDGTGHFTDVTEGSGLQVPLYGMGAAVGDYDDDGRVDLFVTTLYENRLFRNLGGGKFRDLTGEARLAGEPDAWSTSAAWFDMDNDRDLDLFVCNYVDWDLAFDRSLDFKLEGTDQRSYGEPESFPGSFCYLYRNNGDGTFDDVSQSAGIEVADDETGAPMAKALGVVPFDVDRDGWMDLIVANDTVRNFLFHNRGGGIFDEIGRASNVAYTDQGNPRAGMGIDLAYFRNNAVLGCAIGNFGTETTSFFVSQRPETNPLEFADETYNTGVGAPSRNVLTFGLFFFDADLDGRLDLLAANGHVWERIHVVHETQKFRQPTHLYWNVGDPAHLTDYVLMPAEKCGRDLMQEILGRGAAYADIDSDGDLDVVLTDNGGEPLLLRNDQQLGHHWIRLKLEGAGGNRDAIGAAVEVRLGDAVLRRQVMPSRSYLSQVELPVTFGIGERTEVDALTITWPDGSRQDVEDVPIDALMHVRQTD